MPDHGNLSEPAGFAEASIRNRRGRGKSKLAARHGNAAGRASRLLRDHEGGELFPVEFLPHGNVFEAALRGDVVARAAMDNQLAVDN